MAVVTGNGSARRHMLPTFALMAFAVLLLAVAAQPAAAAKRPRPPPPPISACSFCANLRRVPSAAVDASVCNKLIKLMTKDLTTTLRGAGANVSKPFDNFCNRKTGELQVCYTARGLKPDAIPGSQLDAVATDWTFAYKGLMGSNSGCAPRWGANATIGAAGLCLYGKQTMVDSCP